jgi:hypothetical protein
LEISIIAYKNWVTGVNDVSGGDTSHITLTLFDKFFRAIHSVVERVKAR